MQIPTARDIGKSALKLWPLILMPLVWYELGPRSVPFIGHEYALYGTYLSPLLFLIIAMGIEPPKKDVALSVGLSAAMSLILSGQSSFYVYCYIEKFVPSKMQAFPKYFAKFMAQGDFGFILAGIVPLIGTLFIIHTLISNQREKAGSSNKDVSDTHGTAKLADVMEVKSIMTKTGVPIGALAKLRNFDNARDVAVSIKEKGGGEIIRLKPDHAVVVAPSGAGKGIGIVIPTLLEYEGPVLVTDIKGENYAVTARHRRSLGRKVIAFDPFEITDAPKVRINLLDFLDPNSKSIVDDAAMFANLICPVPQYESGNTKYFAAQGGSTIQCLLMYVACSPEYPMEKKNLTTVYDLLCQKSDDINDLFDNIHKDEELAFGAASRIAGSILGTDPRELSGILNSARIEMRFMDTPYIRESTEASDFKLSEITKGNTDLFICIPPEKLETQSRLLRLITGIVFVEMQRARGRVGKDNLLMLIDEMPALGYMPHVEQALVYGRGYGVSVLSIAQTVELIQAVYPKTWQTFFSGHLSILFGTTDTRTAEFISSKMGKTTVEAISSNQGTSQPNKSAGFFNKASKQEGVSHSETGRSLLTPDEVSLLGDEVVIAFYRGQHPIMCKRLNYLKRSEWKGKWDENPLHERRIKQQRAEPFL